MRNGAMRTRNIVVAAIIGSAALIEVHHFTRMLSAPDVDDEIAWVHTHRGRELDRLFVEALITRYKDTMVLAEAERLRGHNPDLRKLAAALVESRRKDLDALLRIDTADNGVPPGGSEAR